MTVCRTNKIKESLLIATIAERCFHNFNLRSSTSSCRTRLASSFTLEAGETLLRQCIGLGVLLLSTSAAYGQDLSLERLTMWINTNVAKSGLTYAYDSRDGKAEVKNRVTLSFHRCSMQFKTVFHTNFVKRGRVYEGIDEGIAAVSILKAPTLDRRTLDITEKVSGPEQYWRVTLSANSIEAFSGISYVLDTPSFQENERRFGASKLNANYELVFDFDDEGLATETQKAFQQVVSLCRGEK